jgi:hypothetical protein
MASFGVIEQNQGLSDNFRKKVQDLFVQYHPIEISLDIPFEE